LIIRALRDSVKIGSPVTIEIIKKNISTHEINDSFIRGTLPYQIEVKDSRGSVMGEAEEFRRANELKAKESIRTFSVAFPTLRPGESSRDLLDMEKYYDLTESGKYTIQVSETDRESNIKVRSNVVTISLVRSIR
jgi:hypothetical protein